MSAEHCHLERCFLADYALDQIVNYNQPHAYSKHAHIHNNRILEGKLKRLFLNYY